VRQGYVLASALFSIATDWILRHIDEARNGSWRLATIISATWYTLTSRLSSSTQHQKSSHARTVNQADSWLPNSASGFHGQKLSCRISATAPSRRSRRKQSRPIDSVDSFVYLWEVFPLRRLSPCRYQRTYWPGVVGNVTSPQLEEPSDLTRYTKTTL